MTAIKLAIFDLDGVIVDTARFHYLAWRRLAGELQIPFTKQDNERLKGVSRMRSLEIILELGGMTKGREEREKLASRKNEWYLEYIKEMNSDEILPGILPFLGILEKEDIKVALASASKNARFILEKIGLTDRFEVIVDGNSVSRAKPAPDAFLLAASELLVKPKRTVVFEDAAAGIEAAKRAGMLAVGIGNPSVLERADLVLPGFEAIDLEELLQKLQYMVR